ncbi:hypothetical protein ACIG0C_07965 [Kitasatospora aureofaciens]|uniref:hypothetical protein n=1 Tax=Kitasatospora aureofaciens TaxID=1894 RepID=UPI0017814934|nr:hypothetical protein [Kitasatospora aureofaciens]UKZ04915.1 hypothetical protein BOQ63_012825 [Streptomyces viridifaciens]
MAGGQGRRRRLRVESGGTAFTAATAAGCAVALLAAGPSWAAPRTAPRPEPRIPVVGPAAVRSDSDLEVVREDPDAAPPGGTTTVRAFVANRGPDTTASPFTVIVTLPDGVTPQGPYFPADCAVLRGGHEVRCVFGAGLKQGRSATALVPVRVGLDVRLGMLTGGSVEVRSPDDRDRSNNRQPFDLNVVETAAGS